MIKYLSQAAEFKEVPVRQGEEALLKALSPYLTYPIDSDKDSKYSETSTKANVLLQCHINRTPLNVDFRID